MLQDRVTSEQNHRRFIARVVASGEVWGLKSSAGWAVCDSNENDASVMPFWSDRAYARRAAKDGWSEYVPMMIPLDRFIDAWLAGMAKDGVLVGTNWDANNCGLEVSALELAKELVATLEMAGRH
jgi:hypothetical protein